MLAMMLDAAAVLGRAVGLPLVGAIELVEACVVVAASSALVGATHSGAHAEVRLLVDRLAPAWRRRFVRASSLLCALFFAWLALGSLFVVDELWRSHETSELLELPIKPLRLFFCASLLVTAWLCARLAVSAKRGPAGHGRG